LKCSLLIFESIDALSQSGLYCRPRTLIDFYPESKLQLLTRIAKVSEQPKVLCASLMHFAYVAGLTLCFRKHGPQVMVVRTKDRMALQHLCRLTVISRGN
jgi:hypothetical protein